MTYATPDTPASDAIDRAYRASLEWLFDQRRGNELRDPDRMRRLVDALGLDFPTRSAHVVGTNGKGTVTSMCAAAVSASGRRSGWFISPHVEDFRERIGVDGESISVQEVVEFVERVRTASLTLAPAFFELTLAMALDHFRRHEVEFAAFEAGVGAKRDATSAITGVSAVALTPIALDHVESLGPTLVDVARDKAAAMRPGVPAASAAQAEEVLSVLNEEAEKVGVVLHVDSAAAPLFARPPAADPEPDPVRLANSRLASAVLRLLGGVPEWAVAAGLGVAPLPGRGERFQVGEITVLLDGAHDPAAAQALVGRAGREYLLLFGSLQRKQGEATLRALEHRSTRTFVTSAGGQPVSVAGTPSRTIVGEPKAALRAALSACPPGGLLVVAGSLYLAGELRPLLRQLSTPGTMSQPVWDDRMEER